LKIAREKTIHPKARNKVEKMFIYRKKMRNVMKIIVTDNGKA